MDLEPMNFLASKEEHEVYTEDYEMLLRNISSMHSSELQFLYDKLIDEEFDVLEKLKRWSYMLAKIRSLDAEISRRKGVNK